MQLEASEKQTGAIEMTQIGQYLYCILHIADNICTVYYISRTIFVLYITYRGQYLYYRSLNTEQKFRKINYLCFII